MTSLADSLRAIRDMKWIGDDTHVQMRKIASDALSGDQERHPYRDSGDLNGNCGICGKRNSHRNHDPSVDRDPLADLVSRFSEALLAKLRAAEQKYGRKDDWLDSNWQADCQRKLLEHVAKGDPRDVAAYAAFCWHHGWPTKVFPITAHTEPMTLDKVRLDAAYEAYWANSSGTYASIEAAILSYLNANHLPDQPQATRESFDRIISALRYDGPDENSLTVGEIRRALP